MYSFISQYDQIKMAEDEENTWFIPKWGAYAYNNAMPLLYAMLFSLGFRWCSVTFKNGD
jgi:hypothetical protein